MSTNVKNEHSVSEWDGRECESVSSVVKKLRPYLCRSFVVTLESVTGKNLIWSSKFRKFVLDLNAVQKYFKSCYNNYRTGENRFRAVGISSLHVKIDLDMLLWSIRSLTRVAILSFAYNVSHADIHSERLSCMWLKQNRHEFFNAVFDSDWKDELCEKHQPDEKSFIDTKWFRWSYTIFERRQIKIHFSIVSWWKNKKNDEWYALSRLLLHPFMIIRTRFVTFLKLNLTTDWVFWSVNDPLFRVNIN